MPEISQKNRFINLKKQVGSFKLTLRYKLWLPIHIIIQHIQYNQIWQLNVLVDLQNHQVHQLGLLYSKASEKKNKKIASRAHIRSNVASALQTRTLNVTMIKIHLKKRLKAITIINKNCTIHLLDLKTIL